MPEGSSDRVAALRGFRAPTLAVDEPVTNLLDVPFACRFAASQVHSRAMSTPLTRQRAGSLSRDQPQADFRGATLRNFTFGDLVQHVRMRRCGLRVGLCGGCARSCLYAQCTTCCTTWLVAFALNLPASLVPPSSRSPPAARSFACRRQAPSMPISPIHFIRPAYCTCV